VVVFVPGNETCEKGFLEYIGYFSGKERMGMVYLKNGLMFVVPPSEASKKYFKEEDGAG